MSDCVSAGEHMFSHRNLYAHPPVEEWNDNKSGREYKISEYWGKKKTEKKAARYVLIPSGNDASRFQNIMKQCLLYNMYVIIE